MSLGAAMQLWGEEERSYNRLETAQLSPALTIVSSLFSAWAGVDLQNKYIHRYLCKKVKVDTEKPANNRKWHCYSKTEKNHFRTTDCAVCLNGALTLTPS